MRYTVKIAQFSDLDEVVAIEKATMGNYTYVDTAWNYFMNSKGDFLCAYDGEQMVGIAHIAILPDGCGWFEALRVHPDHQNQGVGKALYEKALDLAENRYHTPAFSMYTGPRNVRSSGLAARYGLDRVHEFKEYTYSVRETKDNNGFRYTDWKKAEEVFLPLKDDFGGFISINRTMYNINTTNIRALADDGFFYCDDEGNCICLGSRFQHGNKLFIGMAGGDYRKGLEFAENLAMAKNVSNLTCTFASRNTELEEALKQYGFTFVGDLITREKVF